MCLFHDFCNMVFQKLFPCVYRYIVVQSIRFIYVLVMCLPFAEELFACSYLISIQLPKQLYRSINIGRPDAKDHSYMSQKISLHMKLYIRFSLNTICKSIAFIEKN